MARSGGVSAIWPSDALILAAVLRARRGQRAILLLAGFIGNALAEFASGDPLTLVFGLSVCNLLGILVGAQLFLRFAGEASVQREYPLYGARNLAVFALTCGGLAPAASGLPAAILLAAIAGAPFLAVWSNWFLSDALGILTITPIALSLGSAGARALLDAGRRMETLFLIALPASLAAAAFGLNSLPVLFLIFPALILPAFRLEFTGAALATGLVTAIAVMATLLGQGPVTQLTGIPQSERIFLLQVFLLVGNLTALPVASGLGASRLAERRLQQVSNERQAILDGADYAIIATNADGVITQFNVGASRMLGYSAEAVVGRQTPMMFHDPAEIAAEADALGAELGRPVPAGFAVIAERSLLGPHERDWTLLCRDGGRLTVRLSATVLRDAEGRVTGHLGIAKDVTEQRRSERELERSRRDLQRVIDSIPAMIAYWGDDLRNRFCNHAYFEWFGMPADRIMTGMHIREVLGEELFAQNRDSLEAVLRGEQQRFEREVSIPGGERRAVQVHYVPDSRDGMVHGFYVLVFDISMLKLTERALVRAKEVAETATRAKSNFLSQMSHELRTPMNSILGFTELLLTGQPGALSERQREYLGLVHFSADHLRHLIDDILELTQIESGRLKIAEQPVAIRPLVNSVMASLRPLAEKHGVTLQERLEPDLPDVAADFTRAAEVLLNLSSNAVKYNRPGGHVWFTAERIAERRLRIAVSDDGIGIPADLQPSVFHEFNRLGAQYTNVEGTGIGLALAKRFAELMKGTVGFTSREGQGSTFWVDLPLTAAGRKDKDIAAA